MDSSIENFYLKNASENYSDGYDKSHAPRIEFIINQFCLDKITGRKILDIGCGLGNFHKRLHESNLRVGIDGAYIMSDMKLCDFVLYKADINLPFYEVIIEKDFDIVIISEVLEHVTNPYNVIAEAKKFCKVGGKIIISIPSVECWHNYIYPSLMNPKENFEQFLGQMALKIDKYSYWKDGWQCHCWQLENRPYTESKMLFPKNESKFYGKTPLQYVNL